MKKLSSRDYRYVFEMGLVLSVAFSMFMYGIGKPVQFKTNLDLEKPVSALTGMELMWAFYGYSKIYPLIIGAVEIIGACLLVFRKTRLIGGLIITTVLLNVILQDLFYGVHVGALKAAIFYQISILIIFGLNRKLIAAVVAYYFQELKTQTQQKNAYIFVLAGLGAVLLKLLERYLI
jgi:hypothetical protein